MEIHEAISQISQIRSQMAETTVFRGYRSLSVGLTGLLGIAAAVVQCVGIPKPVEQLETYLTLWVGTAAIGLAIVGAEIGVRTAKSQSRLVRQKSRSAIEHFAPCIAAGAVLTAGIERHAGSAWMLPGLWAIVFSLGMFASNRLLPRAMMLVSAYYLVGGAIVLLAADHMVPLSPWTMAILFGGGQLFSAAVLRLTLERIEQASNESE